MDLTFPTNNPNSIQVLTNDFTVSGTVWGDKAIIVADANRTLTFNGDGTFKDAVLRTGDGSTGQATFGNGTGDSFSFAGSNMLDSQATFSHGTFLLYDGDGLGTSQGVTPRLLTIGQNATVSTDLTNDPDTGIAHPVKNEGLLKVVWGSLTLGTGLQVASTGTVVVSNYVLTVSGVSPKGGRTESITNDGVIHLKTGVTGKQSRISAVNGTYCNTGSTLNVFDTDAQNSTHQAVIEGDVTIDDTAKLWLNVDDATGSLYDGTRDGGMTLVIDGDLGVGSVATIKTNLNHNTRSADKVVCDSMGADGGSIVVDNEVGTQPANGTWLVIDTTDGCDFVDSVSAPYTQQLLNYVDLYLKKGTGLWDDPGS